MHATMRILAIVGLILATGLAGARAQAQQVFALKAGESIEVGNAFWVLNCRSLLTGPITIEILEGPPNVTVSMREQKIIPRAGNCANPVDGVVFLVNAPKVITARSQAKLTFRIKFPTVDGERLGTRSYDLILLP